MNPDDVMTLIKDISARIVEPRFRALGRSDVRSKGLGDVVTIADHEAETEFITRLGQACPDAVVIGEESCYADPSLLGAIGAAEHCFVVDPVDGTGNFVRGKDDFAVMVAEMRGPRTVAGWIWQPRHGRAYQASAGGGVTCNGEPIAPSPTHPRPTGAAGQRAWRDFDAAGRISPVRESTHCAGVDYPHVITGRLDFIAYRHPKPWDHLAGGLMLAELGGGIVHLDGSSWAPGDEDAPIISSRDLATAKRVAALWPSYPPRH
ncbi:inositol monophosphatase family protein [Propionibacterium australiense]|uniref:Inositol monophosphatase n=1 Tax=Propionibacterium australiense TaxID=119981 RepID=A0A383S7W7_9ACTN|nr:inositol monophosphatase [Propionibacterium australiense]RLP10974.1 inositol monophosphatase [Propionibacterium australiense]RLP13059.1 inositol monophosphatase [Propionibacterium australiense]SYZ33933.1 Inositol monophosphatase family signature 1 [Propionibacterium australiense]VEH90954.1 Inositol-1-monophosphatase [Propionibacterium australiense]